jgi:TRAP-type mannitol/chloroaromatic compound transport system permease small subunit
MRGLAQQIGRVFDGLISAINAVGTAWIFVLMLLINSDVFMRYLFNAPLNGVPLAISMSIVGIVFLQLPDALRNGRFIRNDALIGRMLEERPVIGHVMETVYNLAGFVFMSVLAWYVWPLLVLNWRQDNYAGTEGEFTLPVWPFLLLTMIGAVCCAVQYLRQTRRDLRYLGGDRSAAERVAAQGEEGSGL